MMRCGTLTRFKSVAVAICVLKHDAEQLRFVYLHATCRWCAHAVLCLDKREKINEIKMSVARFFLLLRVGVNLLNFPLRWRMSLRMNTWTGIAEDWKGKKNIHALPKKKKKPTPKKTLKKRVNLTSY